MKKQCPQDYGFTVDAELLAGIDVYPVTPEADHGGRLIEIQSPTKTWIAQIPEGAGELTGVFPHPNPTWMFAAVGGNGVFVDTASPGVYRAADVYPVCGACLSEDCALLCVWDFVRLAAYGRQGRLWVTERLVIDDLKVVEIRSDRIVVEGWLGPASGVTQLTVRRSDGVVE